MRYFCRCIVVPLLALQIGCASINVRLGAYSDRADVYPATLVDSGIISYVATRPFIPLVDPTFAPDAQEGLVYLFLPGAVVDLPLAIAVDTVLLPYDLHKCRARSDHNESESFSRGTKQQVDEGSDD